MTNAQNIITPVFKMSGEYFGYFRDEKLFDLTNQFIGILDNTEVWRQNGQYLGEIFETNYILRKPDVKRNIRNLIPFPELQELPEIATAREGKTIPNGWIDALEIQSTNQK